jgi:PKD repeat protein
MKAQEIIKFWIYDNTNWVEYSDGILKIDITRGAQNYQGPFTQPDVGQLRLVSRNDQLDPYLNENVRFGSKVKVTADLVTIFTGTIDGVDVQYRPKGEDPSITINCIDMIGTMQKHILNTEFIKTRPDNWITNNLLQDLNFYANDPVAGISGFNCPVRLSSGNNYVIGSINVGTTAWAALSTRAATDLGFVYANAANDIYYYELPYDNANHPNNARPTHIYFEYDGSGTNYLDIKLNDGFENIINNLSFANSWGVWNYPANTTFTTSNYSASYKNEESVELWGPSTKTVNFLSNATYIEEQKDKIFKEMSYPQRDISQITWDATKNSSAARNVDILDNININHELSDEISIDRKYSVIGINHDITESDWRITYILRNWNYVETSMGPVTVIATPQSGDTNTDWSFSVDTDETITSYLWDLGEGQTSTLANPTNIDYDIAGTKNITVTITNIYGWTKTSPVKTITVAGAVATGVTVSYSIDALGIYNFSATGEGADIWFWGWGDGTNSGGQTASHNYYNSGNYTVTLQATNSYGTVTVTTPITVTVGGTVNIRYLKFVWDYLPKGSTTLIPNRVKQLKVYSGGTGGTNRLLNKAITSIKTYYTNLLDNSSSGNIFSLPAAQYYLTDNNNSTNWLYLTGNTGIAGDNSTVYTYAEINYDLGAGYTSLDACQAILDLPAPGSGQSYGPIKVWASTDNVNFFLWGTITPGSTNGGFVTNAVCNMVGSKSLPFNYPAQYQTFPYYPTIPMRYVKANINRIEGGGQVYVAGLFAYNGRNQDYDVVSSSTANINLPAGRPPAYAYSNVNNGSCLLEIDSTNWTGGYQLTNYNDYNDSLPHASSILNLFAPSGSGALNVDLILDLGRIRDDIWTLGILHGNGGNSPATSNNAYVNWYGSVDGINWTTIKLDHKLTRSYTVAGFPYWDNDYITNSPRGHFVTPLTITQQETPF